jgi:asparagine synthase (glutamine-hydrolysing)
VLSGEGSDELLAGYPKHWGDAYVRRLQAILPNKLGSYFWGFLSRRMPYRLRRLAILLRVAQERDFLDRQTAWFGPMPTKSAAELCPELFTNYKPFAWADDPGPGVGNLHRALTFDKTIWLPGTLLERGDRMTMAASLEGRMPFMDVELCRFVATLPDSAFLSGRVGKQILRHAMAQELPQEILTKPKWGFRIPIHDWVRGDLREYVRDMLLGPDSEFSSYYNRDRVEALLADHIAMRRNSEKEIWSFLALELFLRQLKDKPSVRTPLHA